MKTLKTRVTFILAAALMLACLDGEGLAAPQTDKQIGKKTAKGTVAPNTRVIYPKRTELDFEGIRLEGELRNPGEFYFQYRPEEKFDSLVQRRKNFHREMLRDVVLTK